MGGIQTYSYWRLLAWKGGGVLEITSEMTQNKTHTQETDDTHTPAGGTELHKLFALYYYKAPLGRIPDCMNKPFQYSAGAYMLSNSKRE